MMKLSSLCLSSFLSSTVSSKQSEVQTTLESYLWYIMCIWNATIIIIIIIFNIIIIISTNSNILTKSIIDNKDDYDIHDARDNNNQSFLVLHHDNNSSSSSSFWLLLFLLCISSFIPLIHSSFVLLLFKKKWDTEKEDEHHVERINESYGINKDVHDQHLRNKIDHEQEDDVVTISKDNNEILSSSLSFSSLWRNNDHENDDNGIIMSIVLLPTMIQSIILHRFLLLTKNQNSYYTPNYRNDIIYYSISFSIGLIIIIVTRSKILKKKKSHVNRNNDDDDHRKTISINNKSNSIKEKNRIITTKANSSSSSSSSRGNQWKMKQIAIIQWILPISVLLLVRHVTISYHPLVAVNSTTMIKMFKYVFCYSILLLFMYHSITNNQYMKSFHGVFTLEEYIVMIGIIGVIVIEYLFTILYYREQQQHSSNNHTINISLSTWVSLSGLIGCCIACYCTPWLLSLLMRILTNSTTTMMKPKNKSTSIDHTCSNIDEKKKMNEIKLMTVRLSVTATTEKTNKKNESSLLSSSKITMMMIGWIKLLIIIIITAFIVETQFQFYINYRMSYNSIINNNNTTTTTTTMMNDDTFDNTIIIHNTRDDDNDNIMYSYLRRTSIGWLFNEFLYQSAIENNDDNYHHCYNNIACGSSISNSNNSSSNIFDQNMLYQWMKQKSRYIWLLYWFIVLLVTIPMLFILQGGKNDTHFKTHLIDNDRKDHLLSTMTNTGSKTENSCNETITKAISTSDNDEDRKLQQQRKDKQVILMDRKWFHLIAIMLFVPPTIYASQLLSICYAIGLALLIVFEMIRHDIPWINQFYSHYLDVHNKNEQSNTIIISHIGLIVGCAIPLWISRYLIITSYNEHDNDNHCLSINNSLLSSFHLLLSCWGIICIGVGDAMGAVIGIRYGNIQWSKHNSRTIEGSIAMFLSMCFCCYVITSSTMIWLPAVIFVTLLEAWTKQIDNFVLPLAGVTILLLTINTITLWSIINSQ